jgi:glycosyltransferase involved in cell wall biosynthesis
MVSEIASKQFSQTHYQSIGSAIFNDNFKTKEDIINKTGSNPLFINPNTVYSVSCYNIEDLLKSNDIYNYPEAIGFHWYAGHPDMGKMESKIDFHNYEENNTLVSSAIQVVNLEPPYKKYLATILITTYKRSHLLDFGLSSLGKQNLNRDEIEVIVINDGLRDETADICKKHSDKLNIKYIFTGHRNLVSEQWRCPSIAFNIGAKHSDSEFLFISCAEMYHLDNTINNMLSVLKNNPKALTIPFGRDDETGEFLEYIKKSNKNIDEKFNTVPLLVNIRFPFFMGMRREHFFAIGGYSEDFSEGIGFDDNYIVYCLNAIGCSHQQTKDRVVHLYHPRLNTNDPVLYRKLKNNETLFYNKKNSGIIVSNKDTEWGIL